MKIGTDICKISRMEGKSSNFYEKYFTKNELEHAKSRRNFSETLAGIFSAKESVVKMMKGACTILSVEITHQGDAPTLTDATFEKLKISKNDFDLSISHDGDYAVSVAILKE